MALEYGAISFFGRKNKLISFFRNFWVLYLNRQYSFNIIYLENCNKIMNEYSFTTKGRDE